MILRGKRARNEFGGPPASIRLGTVPFIGSPASPLEFGRFLLSSVGLHLLLGWAVATVGLRSTPPSEKPLQVRFVEAEAPKASPTTPPSARARSRQQAASQTSSAPDAGSEQIAPRDLARPTVAPAEVAPSRTARIIDTTDPDERRRTASRRSAAELENDSGLPAGIAPFPGVRIAGGDNVGAPKAIGPRAIGGGGLTVLRSGGVSSGPATLGGSGGGGDGGAGSVSRGSARRLGPEITATLAPTVTVGSSRAGAAGGAGGGRGRATGGRSAGPDYGANPPPAYPPLARERGYEGTVYLRVQVKGDGKVGALAIDRTSGYDILDRAAADSVREWTFLPAQKDGRPMTSWVLLPVKFMLK